MTMKEVGDLTDRSNYKKGAILQMQLKDFMQFRTVTINPGTSLSISHKNRRFRIFFHFHFFSLQISCFTIYM